MTRRSWAAWQISTPIVRGNVARWDLQNLREAGQPCPVQNVQVRRRSEFWANQEIGNA